MDKIKVLYVDDEIRDLNRYKKLFEKSKYFDVNRLQIKSNTDIKAIRGKINKNVDLILIDLKTRWTISGATLASDIRQNSPDYPLILFTKKDILDEGIPQRIRAALTDILDNIVYKDNLRKSPEKIFRYLYELGTGYKLLKNTKNKKWSNLLELLKAPKDDENELSEAKPPLEPNTSWTIFLIAKWINDVLLKYPGILYNSVYAATELGISEKAFLSEDVQKIFKNAKYDGIFKYEDLWWKSRLYSLAREIRNENERSLRLNQGFPMAWERKNKIKLKPSKCISSGESPADGICCKLKKPMMLKYSLKYNMDSRPSIMKEARISHKAIKTEDINENFIDPLDREEFKKIRTRGRSKRQ